MAIEIRLPVLAPDFEGGTIESWNKRVGDIVAKGDVLFSLESDKALVDVEAEADGVLGKIVFDAGSEDVPVNHVVGYLLEAGETVDDLPETESPARAELEKTAADPAAEASHQPAPADTRSIDDKPHRSGARPDRILAGPAARRIARQLGLSLEGITGRGPKGRILKVDVEKAAVGRSVAPALAAPVSDFVPVEPHQTIPNSAMRKTIARRLTESKQQVPHFYLKMDCDMDRLLSFRGMINVGAKNDDGSPIKVSINDFIVKSCALALRDMPEVNASWSDQAVHQYERVDVSIAVATPNGLLTPVVRNADKKGLVSISKEVVELATRARAGKLKPSEYQGGGFSISNLGMFGVREFSAIINPPQSCILAVGLSEQRPVVKNGCLAIGTQVSCTLSVDHRVVDGAVAARFIQVLKTYIENPGYAGDQSDYLRTT